MERASNIIATRMLLKKCMEGWDKLNRQVKKNYKGKKPQKLICTGISLYSLKCLSISLSTLKCVAGGGGGRGLNSLMPKKELSTT